MVVHLHVQCLQPLQQFSALLLQRSYSLIRIQRVQHRLQVGSHQLLAIAHEHVSLRNDDIVQGLAYHHQASHVGLYASSVVLHAGLEHRQVGFQAIGAFAGVHVMVKHRQTCHSQAQRLVAVRRRLVSKQRSLQRGSETLGYLTHQGCALFRQLVVFQLHVLEHLVYIQPLDALEVEQVGLHHLDRVAVDVDELHGIVAIHHAHIATQRGEVLDVSTHAVLGIMIRLHHLSVFIEHGRRLAPYVLHAIGTHDYVCHFRSTLSENERKVLLHLLFQLL